MTRFQGDIEPAPLLAQLTPAQRLRAVQAFRDLRDGRIEMPHLRCQKCAGSALLPTDDDEVLSCASCGAHTSREDAHLRRRQEVARLIFEIGRGEDRVRVRRRAVPHRKPGHTR